MKVCVISADSPGVSSAMKGYVAFTDSEFLLYITFTSGSSCWLKLMFVPCISSIVEKFTQLINKSFILFSSKYSIVIGSSSGPVCCLFVFKKQGLNPTPSIGFEFSLS